MSHQNMLQVKVLDERLCTIATTGKLLELQNLLQQDAYASGVDDQVSPGIPQAYMMLCVGQ